MRRREFVVGFGAAAWSVAARGQPARVPRIGVLGNEDSPLWHTFRQGLRDLGYEEGRNLVIEWRWSENRPDRFPRLAAELAERQVDVIVTSSSQASLAAKRATTTVPIVMALTPYPDRLGLVENLARP